MLSMRVHYMNKYPGGRVSSSDSAFDVYDAEGRHCVSLAKNGAGMWADRSAEYGCAHCHDLAPIPKDARVKKVVDGKIVDDEQAADRMEMRKAFVKDGKIQSCSEIGLSKFDEKQRLLK